MLIAIRKSDLPAIMYPEVVTPSLEAGAPGLFVDPDEQDGGRFGLAPARRLSS